MVKTKVEKLHFLVPIHEILSEEEKNSLLKKLGIEAKNLPKIKRLDPGIKKLKPTKGDVVKIYRDSHTAGEHVYYRIVA